MLWKAISYIKVKIQNEHSKDAGRKINMSRSEVANAIITSVDTSTCDLDTDCAWKGEECNRESFDTRDMNAQKKLENLTKWFRLTDGYLFTRPGKSKYVLLVEKKMVCDVLQGIIPIYDHLTEVERGILEEFGLTEKRNWLKRSPHISPRRIYNAIEKNVKEKTA